MSLLNSITIRPSLTYLFSYVWLACELIGFGLLIHFYAAPESYVYISIAMIVFARLYYWLDFSPESGIQSLFILGLIPLLWIVYSFNYSVHLHLIFLLYSIALICFGILRVLSIKFRVNSIRVLVQFIRSKSIEIDHSRSFKMHQHSRGKVLNFGCILIPIIDSEMPKGNLLMALLFDQRYSKKYSGFLRLDGIRNPKEAFQIIKNLPANEKD